LAASPNQLPLKYEGSLPSGGRHPDTSPPRRLSDGACSKPETESVEYPGDVAITCDLGSEQDVKEAAILPFYRDGGDFNAESVLVQTSLDKKAWKDVAAVKCDRVQGPVVLVTAPVGDKVRYVRFNVTKAADAKRLLIGEVRITKPDTAAAAQPPPPAPAPKPFARLAKPLQVKRVLDQALLDAKVDFLFGCFATDVLRDEAGQPCGIVMANRSGRQAVLAKVIIDATDRAWVARMAGAQAQPYPRGPQVFHRVVVGGEPTAGPAISEPRPSGSGAVQVRKVGLTFAAANKTHEIYEYTLQLSAAGGSYAALAAADQTARDKTFHLGQVDASEVLFQVPPDPVKGAGAGDLGAFRPAGVPRMYLVGGCADVPREEAARLLRPLALMDLGTKIGAAAAAEAKSLPAVSEPRPSGSGAVKGAKVPGGPVVPAAPGDVKEILVGVRPTQTGLPTVPSEARGLRVLGRYDVVVIGGGTGGAPAGIGAGRQGAKTLLVEYLHGLGGVGTTGMISKYYFGYRGGFTAEIDAAVKELGAANEVVGKIECWRRANRKAGTEIWFGAMGVGAFVEGDVVKGAIVATPEGRGVVLAKTVIDSTGNADIAAAAGAQTDYTGGDEASVQGAGLPPLNLGAGYTNTDYMFADDTDVVDFWQLFVYAREKFKGAYDLGQLVDTRERRRIVGDVTISPMDIILSRTWPDTVVLAKSNFDSHGFTVHPLFWAMPPGHESITAFVPLRALLPKGLDGIVVTGLGVSAHRDAMPVIRMQPDVQNQGYAMGVAAAMVARSAGTIRGVDLRGLQKHLVQVQCLPEEVLTDKDSFPMPKEKVAAAVTALAAPFAEPPPRGQAPGEVERRRALAVIFAQPQDAIPLIERAYAAAKADDAKLIYAHVLALFGNKTGADTLLARVKSAAAFDKGWNYTGMGQFGRSVSELDQYIIALGRTRDPRAADAILEKVALLDATKEFSHHRACAVALETLGDPRAARPLADLLAKPGMTGHSTVTVDEAKRIAAVGGGTENRPRNESLREIVLARALYRCGDSGGVGKKTLERYAQDLRGHYARHAQAVLRGEGTNK
ncbi:MAG: FAD-dependent oxidoreductase, partial [Planctomycetes bacterium]|nr:FAD-dependent oxidoreductase [Planctomycetota bacterium]